MLDGAVFSAASAPLPVARLQGVRWPCAQDLQEWRKRLSSQVQGYQEEIGGLRSKLLGEMEALKAEFTGLRAALQQQMAATWAAVGQGSEAPPGAADISEAPGVPQAAEDAVQGEANVDDQ